MVLASFIKLNALDERTGGAPFLIKQRSFVRECSAHRTLIFEHRLLSSEF